MWSKIRNDFPVFRNYVYLQTQGGGPISNSLIEETNKRLIELSINGSDICNEWDVSIAKAKGNLAKLISCSVTNLAFIPNTSFAMNTLAYSLNNKFNVLTFKDDFPNSSLPWINRGYNVDFVKSDSNGNIRLEDIKASITSDTKILITSHVMYRSGFKQDLKELGELCKLKDIIFIVDATQSFGVFDINVNDLNIDVLMFHGYKWLNSGFGIGGMYVSNQILQEYKKPFLGFTSVNYLSEQHDTTSYEIKNNASAYELGKTPYLNILMLGFMLQKINAIGIPNIENRVLGKVLYLLNKCRENSIEIVSDFESSKLSGIVNIKAYGLTKTDLKKKGIIVRSDADIITIGIHYYNNESDIDKLIKIVKKAFHNFELN